MSLGQKIRELRTVEHFPSKKWGRELEVNHTHAGQYERSQVSPNAAILLRMTRFFNVCLDYLIPEGDEVVKAIQKFAVAKNLIGKVRIG